MHADVWRICIQGNCATAPPPASAFRLPPPEWLWEAPQCLIVSDGNIFTVDEPLWLDALYLRRRPSTWPLFPFINVERNAELYATGLTIQGNGGLNTSVHYGVEGSKAIYQGAPAALLALTRACTFTCWRLPRDDRLLHNEHGSNTISVHPPATAHGY